MQLKERNSIFDMINQVLNLQEECAFNYRGKDFKLNYKYTFEYTSVTSAY